MRDAPVCAYPECGGECTSCRPKEEPKDVARARRLHGVTVPPSSASWPEIATLQRAGLIRIEEWIGKSAKLRFVDPAAVARAGGGA